MDYSITQIWFGHAALAESPMWHPREQKLYWIDITKGHINCLDISTQENKYIKIE